MYSIEEYDANKTKVLKFVLYKKRTKQEVKNKFLKTIDEEMLIDILDELEENGYIDDSDYVRRLINDYKILNNLSMKEVRYKLFSKGIANNLIDNYFSDNYEELIEYERESARKLAIKKSNTMDEIQIKQFLLKKGYNIESIEEAINEL